VQTRWITVLAAASLLAGAVTPWIMSSSWPSDTAVASSEGAREMDMPSASAPVKGSPTRARSQEVGAAAITPRGVIALGDRVIQDAAPCLESRGIDVYPKVIGTPEDLLSAVQHLSGRHASLIIHTGERTGLVDGQIKEVLDTIGSDRTVVWSTIRVPPTTWGAFSFEDRTNASIRNVVGSNDAGRVLDWSALIRKTPSWTLDGMSISPTGCEEYAKRVAKLSKVKQRG